MSDKGYGKSGKTKEERIEQMEAHKAKESEKAVVSDEIQDPEWAKTSCVDPKTGIHITQWRQEEVRKRNANA